MCWPGLSQHRLPGSERYAPLVLPHGQAVRSAALQFDCDWRLVVSPSILLAENITGILPPRMQIYATLPAVYYLGESALPA
jgi:hypothetical protein